MSTLPFEIIEDILRRLPVITLKRFRAVAKSWCYLIDSSDFVKLHLHQSIISNSHRNLIIGGLGVYSVDLDSPEKARVIKPPFYYKSVDAISNSCNGVVLVMSEPPVMWNPFSMDYKALPECGADYPTEAELYSRTTFGFGYDSTNDDYKVVRIVEFRNERTHVWMYSEAMIYGLKSNRWRRLEHFSYPLPFLRGHWRVHVNGALHTLVAKPGSQFTVKIMAFSVESEGHYAVAMPPGVQIKGVDMSLDVIDGCLSLVCAYRSRVIIWVMKDYAVKESWTRLPAISPSEQGDFLKPLVYSREGDKILLNCSDKKLVWYGLSLRTVEDVLVDGMPFVFYAEPCVQTLVSPNALETVVKHKQDTEKHGHEKKKGKKIIKNKRDDFLSEGFKLVL